MTTDDATPADPVQRLVGQFRFIHSTKSDTEGLGYCFRVMARPIFSPDDCDDDCCSDYVGIGIYQLRNDEWSAVFDDITPAGAKALIDALRDVLNRLPNSAMDGQPPTQK